MRPEGEAARLFDALSRTAVRAFADQRLLSCQVLAKGPDQGDLLRRFLRHRPSQPQNASGPRPGMAEGLSESLPEAMSEALSESLPLRLTPRLALRLAARYLAANGLHLAFMLLTALLARLRGWQSPLAKKTAAITPATSAGLVIIDSFAVLPRLAQEGVWRDLYLPGLAAEAKARGYPALTLYRLYGSRHPLVLWRALGVLAAAGPGLLETHLLRPGDWLRLVSHILLYPVSLLRLIASLKKYPPGAPERFIREALIATAGQCVLTGEARRLAGLRLAQSLGREADLSSPPRAHIISWYENQTVNKTFMRGLRQGMGRGKAGTADPIAAKAGAGSMDKAGSGALDASGTVNTDRPAIFCTGAQLFLWPAALLNNHADDAEAALGLAPDRVLVNGPHFLPEKSGQDYAVGPSLRYAHLFDRDWPRPAAAKDLLVLLSYHPAQTRRVLEAARELAAGQSAGQSRQQNGRQPGKETGTGNDAPGGPGLLFRFHPATRPEDYADLLPPGARFSSGSLDQALASATAVMGAASGSLAEAAAMGLPVLALESPEAEGGLNYLPEQGRGLLWQSIRQGREAPAALEALRLCLDDPGRDEAVAAFRDLLFTRPTPEAVSRLLNPH